jgi:hypothetical protein
VFGVIFSHYFNKHSKIFKTKMLSRFHHKTQHHMRTKSVKWFVRYMKTVGCRMTILSFLCGVKQAIHKVEPYVRGFMEVFLSCVFRNGNVTITG